MVAGYLVRYCHQEGCPAFNRASRLASVLGGCVMCTSELHVLPADTEQLLLPYGFMDGMPGLSEEVSDGRS